MIPSPSTGLLHTNTQYKSPPKNKNALFDFAASGPVLGMVASYIALLIGLQQTAGIETEQLSSLPHIPLQFLQLSSLTSATIETCLGTDVLMSLDPVSDAVALHPLALAGHVGILVNALNLLPTTSTTDGGRMLHALVTRNSLIAKTLPVVMNLVLLLQGFRGYGTSDMIILYWLITSFLHHQIETPCRNNVDTANGLRLPLFVFTTLLALIAINPVV